MNNMHEEHSGLPEDTAGNSLTPADAELAAVPELHEGDVCPKCKVGRMDYDGLLNLSCNRCGFTGDRGVFTC